ncbi:hypothetical protein ACH5RR_025517 [Cinchona calisaya]|uniref:Uncharacterized protein n=1 Tax=Cinchona calisaya TaxID=153742 RepID=A0ABD2Z385_9GENT
MRVMTFRNGKLSGIAWSPSTKTWSTKPDKNSVEKPNAIKWRNSQINNYDCFEELFAKDRATGQGTEIAKEKHKRWDKENVIQADNFMDLEHLLSQDEISLESFDSITKEAPIQMSKFCDKKSNQEEEVFNELCAIEVEPDLIDDCYLFLAQSPD